MKIRNGFVSNSSSSSFVCDQCGEEASGWDLSINDAEMIECQNGHTFCKCHIDKKSLSAEYLYDYIMKQKDYLEDIDESEKEDIESYKEDEDADSLMDVVSTITSGYAAGGLPSDLCPLCHFSKVTDDDMCLYLLTKAGMTVKECTKEIKEKFKTYEEFEKYINRK